MGVYVHDSNWGTRRGIAIAILILFHLLLFWGLKSGFAMKVIETLAPPIVADIIQEAKEEEAPPPPPPPKMELPPVEVPPPVIDISIPVETNTTAISNVTDRPPPAPPPPPAAAPPAPPQLKLSRANQPNVSDYYPPTSQRLGEEGVVRVKICVGTNGRVSSATVDASSGFERLDEAGVKVAKLYRFNPVTQEVCNVLPVRFKLDEGR
jgi:periplasmic protein TonB